MQAAYDRHLKCRRNELITQDDFVIERGPKKFEEKQVRALYDALAALVAQNKLEASAVHAYASFRWLNYSKYVVAYKVEHWGWQVNNCGTEISEGAAIVVVNREWGFEASRIKIIGAPYYEATDYQFIRFDCAHMTWLWRNSSLYQVYT